MLFETPRNRLSGPTVQPDTWYDRPVPGAAPGTRARAEKPVQHRQRFPSMRELAALVVDGVLELPARYRRGMYLDLMV